MSLYKFLQYFCKLDATKKGALPTGKLGSGGAAGS